MFWKKKKTAGDAVDVSPTDTVTSEEKVPAAKSEVLKPKAEKLPGPKDLPMPVGRDIVVQFKKEPDWVWSLRTVVRKNPTGKKVFDVRVFSERTAAEKNVKVRDYTSLDEHPELILFEGWFDEESAETHIVERKTA